MDICLKSIISKNLDKLRPNLCDLDLDLEISNKEKNDKKQIEQNPDINTILNNKINTKSEIKQQNAKINMFTSTLNFIENKRQKEKFFRTGKDSNNTFDIINDISEIEKIDLLKSWKQLDKYMKNIKIKNAINILPDNQKEIANELFINKYFYKSSNVIYDIETGNITKLLIPQSFTAS